MVRRWYPFKDLLSLHDQILRLAEWEEGRGRLESESLIQWRPAADISEDAEAIYLYIEIPGMNESSLDLVVEDRVLILRGERKRPRLQGTTYLQSEILIGRFERRFRLPAQVQREKITARYHNGILEVVIPKQPAELKTIEICTAS